MCASYDARESLSLPKLNFRCVLEKVMMLENNYYHLNIGISCMCVSESYDARESLSSPKLNFRRVLEKVMMLENHYYHLNLGNTVFMLIKWKI